MNNLILTHINIYPIKSLKGIALDTARVEERGLQYDRRWMLIDSNNRFISQRECSQLATLSVSIESDGLQVTAADRAPLFVPLTNAENGEEQVTIWSSTVSARVVSKQADTWFSEATGMNCRLVQMPDETRRQVNPLFAVAEHDVVSFADGYPFLLANESSLADLNSRLSQALPMNRFRPNFVVSGALAFAEDKWKLISIGDTSFHVVKPSERCVITTIDQDRGERTGDEPLKTLATFRQWNNGVCFGQNLIAAKPGGELTVGDPVKVIT